MGFTRSTDSLPGRGNGYPGSTPQSKVQDSGQGKGVARRGGGGLEVTAEERPKRLEVIRCREQGCNDVVLEYFESDLYPAGAIRIKSRHHGESHQNVIDLSRYINRA